MQERFLIKGYYSIQFFFPLSDLVLISIKHQSLKFFFWEPAEYGLLDNTDTMAFPLGVLTGFHFIPLNYCQHRVLRKRQCQMFHVLIQMTWHRVDNNLGLFLCQGFSVVFATFNLNWLTHTFTCCQLLIAILYGLFLKKSCSFSLVMIWRESIFKAFFFTLNAEHLRLLS